MNVEFLQDYKDDYRQYNNSQYGEVPDFVGYRLIREKIAVRAGFLVFIDPKRENYGNDLVSINEAVKRISTGCFLPNPEIMLRLYAPTTIDEYDWVGYTDYDFEFIEDIIQALPTDKRLLFWECVYNQYCKCTTNDYERHGRNKQDFEERLRLNKPTATPETQQTEIPSETESSTPIEKTFDIDKARETLKDYFIATFKGIGGSTNHYEENFIKDFKRLAETSTKKDLYAFLLIAYYSEEMNPKKKPNTFKKWTEICSDSCGMTTTCNYKPNSLKPIASKMRNTYYYFHCEWKDESQK